jgi:hypothetical protein
MPRKGYSDVIADPERESKAQERGREWAQRMMEAKRKKQEQADPTKQKPLEEQIGTGQRKLEESDRARLRLEVRQDEEAIRAIQDPEQKLRSQSVDVASIKARLDRNKMILGHDDELNASGSEKDRLHARLKEITEILQKNMPTKREMWPKTGSVEAQQAVRHNVRFQEQYGALCHEFQELKKRLEPDDPYAHSLELIRPD